MNENIHSMAVATLGDRVLLKFKSEGEVIFTLLIKPLHAELLADGLQVAVTEIEKELLK